MRKSLSPASTNVRYETATNVTGQYYLASLPPGLYRIEVEKPGFNKAVNRDVVLHVQDALEINFEMKVGSVSETLTAHLYPWLCAGLLIWNGSK